MCIIHKEKRRKGANSHLRRRRDSDIIVEKGGGKMRDFPIFTTEYGVVSLVLREIPYRNEAYIRILDVQPGMTEELLKECAAFCRMAGARRIFAAGEGLEAHPKGAAIMQMRGPAQPDPEKTVCLFPVTEETVSHWRELHNKAMAGVDNAATLEKRDERRILEKPGAYFVHDAGVLLGIGWVQDGCLLAVAAVQKGAGEKIMHTLMTLTDGEDMVLEVASTNERAIRLYEKLGFLPAKLVTQWHILSI